MSNRLLPHMVTYYKRRSSGEDFERTLLYPVRVQEEASEQEGILLRSAELFVLCDELIPKKPDFAIGDYFVVGRCREALPPYGRGAYRVVHMLPRLDYNALKLEHLSGMGEEGVSDEL